MRIGFLIVAVLAAFVAVQAFKYGMDMQAHRYMSAAQQGYGVAWLAVLVFAAMLLGVAMPRMARWFREWLPVKAVRVWMRGARAKVEARERELDQAPPAL